jgi:hypothetical protein
LIVKTEDVGTVQSGVTGVDGGGVGGMERLTIMVARFFLSWLGKLFLALEQL